MRPLSEATQPQGSRQQGQADPEASPHASSGSPWPPAFNFPTLEANASPGRDESDLAARASPLEAGRAAPGDQRTKRPREENTPQLQQRSTAQKLRLQPGFAAQFGSQGRPPVSAGMTFSFQGKPPSSLKQDSSHASFSRVTSMASLLAPGALPQQEGQLSAENDEYLMKLLWKGRSPANPTPSVSAAETKSAEVGTGARASSAAASWPQGKLTAPATRALTAPVLPPKASSNPRLAAVRTALGEARYSEARAATLKHQEVFLGQLFELHRVMQIQRHLVGMCDLPEAMYKELAKLEAEQKLRMDAQEETAFVKRESGKKACMQQPRSTYAQQHPQPLNPASRVGCSSSGVPAAAEDQSVQHAQQEAGPSTSGRSANPLPGLAGPQFPDQAAGAGQQLPHAQPPFAQQQFPQAGPWAGMYGSWGSYPFGQAQMPMGNFPAWGAAGLGMNAMAQGIHPMAAMGGAVMGGNPMGGLGGNPFGGFSHPFAGPYGVMDPLTAWYAMHYGQHCAHAAALTQANAARGAGQQQQQQQLPAPVQEPAAAQQRSQSQASPGGAQNQKAGEGRANPASLRWWQDPEKVFGIAANPEVVARHSQPMLGVKPPSRPMHASATEATSKPTWQQSGEREGSRTPEEEDPPAKASTKRRAPPSAGTGSAEPMLSQGAPSHWAGSGVSAFKKLPSKAGKARPPPTQAESIGSEVSRSAVERSAMDEGESSGVAHGAPQQAVAVHEAAAGKRPGGAKSAADILVSLSGV